jgi:hypothetical protein
MAFSHACAAAASQIVNFYAAPGSCLLFQFFLIVTVVMQPATAAAAWPGWARIVEGHTSENSLYYKDP